MPRRLEGLSRWCGLVLALPLAGCGGARGPLYEGERRAPHEVARIVEGSGRATITIRTIDGQQLSGTSWEVLPGEHVVGAEVKIFKTFQDGSTVSRSWFRLPCIGTFQAEAGRKYVVAGETDPVGHAVLAVTLTLGMTIVDSERPEEPLGEVSCHY